MLFEITPSLIVNTRYIIFVSRERFGTYDIEMEGGKIITVNRKETDGDMIIRDEETENIIEVALCYPSHLMFERRFDSAIKSQEVIQ